ncbi:hypothetical protein F4780DRAFT_769516 [Xylariomycetidae sp. FL0641]|nr:hypothetical protein F4780DRAFT_769516 [Xylariomycetidae sp. FL0641]
MANNHSAPLFERALESFKKDLKKKDLENFSRTTMSDLMQSLEDVQKVHHSQRRGKNLARLKPFLEAMSNLGKVIEVFTNTSATVAFVWIAGSFAEAFHGILDVYERLGESLPLLVQSESLFHTDINMRRLLSLIYKDILEFHRQALRYFQQPMWKQLFQATWKTYESRFKPLIENIHAHGDLIQRQATLSEIESIRKDSEMKATQLQLIQEEQVARRTREIHFWLRPPTVENDHRHNCILREKYQNTGRWFLETSEFKEWVDPKYPTIPPLLWVNGVPGAGKTVLASLVIEEIRQLAPVPVVLFFYCRSGDRERDNFGSIGRSFLSQLLRSNKDILMPLYYDKFASSTEAVLETHTLIESMLEVALLNCPSVYIVLDGIDECTRTERKKISQWFRCVVENLPPAHPERVRCLFISQDDGVARKDFGGITTFKMEEKHNRRDIEAYSTAAAEEIQSQLDISDDMKNRVQLRMQDAAGGMFLLARLIFEDLRGSPTVLDLEEQLEDDQLPRELNDAYSRITSRIFDPAKPREREASSLLLRWLVCAKRALKWREIQAVKSIDVENQVVDLEHRRFVCNSKDLCGSLVEIREDGTVEFVHSTARLFLMNSQYVDVFEGEVSLALTSIDYLNMKGFRRSHPAVVDLLRAGFYGFMDYCVPHWIRHLEESLNCSEEKEKALADFPESLEAFLQTHYTAPTTHFQISQGTAKKLSFFQDYDFHEDLEQAITSTRKEVSFLGEMKASETALDLAEVVRSVRHHLEAIYMEAKVSSPSLTKRLEEIYGSNIFKCPRLSCRYFDDGFPTDSQRDAHLEKHLRPYRCAITGCPTHHFRVATAAELKKHMENVHGSYEDDVDFPQDSEISRSLRPATPPRSIPKPQAVTYNKPEKRPRITEFPCGYCSKVFNRKHNRDSHELTHNGKRDHKCPQCEASFVRVNDLVRHGSTHKEKQFICGGEFNGKRWGCQKKFPRADNLRSHYKSSSGQSCVPSQMDIQSLMDHLSKSSSR